MPIHNAVHNIGQNQSGTDIKHRMLLDEHGGENDTRHQYKRNQLDCFVFLKLLIVRHSQMNPDGIIYMDTREQIGRSIRCVQHLAKLREDIVVCKIVRTQIMSVRIYG